MGAAREINKGSLLRARAARRKVRTRSCERAQREEKHTTLHKEVVSLLTNSRRGEGWVDRGGVRGGAKAGRERGDPNRRASKMRKMNIRNKMIKYIK